jgi:hypothetical protein
MARSRLSPSGGKIQAQSSNAALTASGLRSITRK